MERILLEADISSLGDFHINFYTFASSYSYT
jgi:hypothetical protein